MRVNTARWMLSMLKRQSSQLQQGVTGSAAGTARLPVMNVAYVLLDDPAEFLEIARYDWLVTKAWNRLHFAEIGEEYYPEIAAAWMVTGPVRLACGRTAGALWIPGIGSRLSMPRCTGCCRALGYPQGAGSPKNCDAIRPMLGLETP